MLVLFVSLMLDLCLKSFLVWNYLTNSPWFNVFLPEVVELFTLSHVHCPTSFNFLLLLHDLLCLLVVFFNPICWWVYQLIGMGYGVWSTCWLETYFRDMNLCLYACTSRIPCLLSRLSFLKFSCRRHETITIAIVKETIFRVLVNPNRALSFGVAQIMMLKWECLSAQISLSLSPTPSVISKHFIFQNPMFLGVLRRWFLEKHVFRNINMAAIIKNEAGIEFAPHRRESPSEK